LSAIFFSPHTLVIKLINISVVRESKWQDTKKFYKTQRKQSHDEMYFSRPQYIFEHPVYKTPFYALFKDIIWIITEYFISQYSM